MTKTQTAADSIAHWSILLLFFLLPFFLVPLPWVTVAQSKMLLFAILLGVAIVGWLVARYLANLKAGNPPLSPAPSRK